MLTGAMVVFSLDTATDRTSTGSTSTEIVTELQGVAGIGENQS